MENMHPQGQKILACCTAYLLGEEVPTQTTSYPDIIHEPLKRIFSSCKVKRADLLRQTAIYVEVQVFNSGIIVEEKSRKVQGKHPVNWYPIQNLYCSASLKPDKEHKTKSQKFSELHSNDQTRQPLFAMVMRQPGKDGRRVLMCSAFLTNDVSQARKLVQATQHAYQNRDGWTHPVADKEFLNAKLVYTLRQSHDKEESSLEELKVKTNERDQLLAQHPSPSKARESVRSSPQPAHSVVTHSSRPVSSIALRGVSRSPHQIATNYDRPPVIFAAAQPPTGRDSRMPTPRAQSLYRGFTTETANGQYRSILSTAPMGSAVFTAVQPTPATSRPTSFRETDGSPRRWRNRMSDTPRGHRVIASSEPEELPNGLSNGVEVPIVDWNTTVPKADDQETKNESHNKADKSSKHHRPSKKTMEKFLHQNGGEVDLTSNGRARRLSQESGSSYSIARLDGAMNGFISGHEQADQNL